MAYKPSPRPTYDSPTHIPFSATTRHLWGDETSGRVHDWVYVSSDKIHQLILGLPVGGAFRHSEEFKTKFAADELYYVLSGDLALANPETGEVRRAKPGEAIFFRRDTWHHGFNIGIEELRVLELISPPPSQGTCGQYALTQPDLEIRKYVQDELLGSWPMVQSENRANQTMHVLRDTEITWRLEGENQSLLVGILVSTEYLTAGTVRVLPGDPSNERRHAGDLALYVVEGSIEVRLPDHTESYECNPGDGFYVPEGFPYLVHNVTDRPSTFLSGVGPTYLPTDG